MRIPFTLSLVFVLAAHASAQWDFESDSMTIAWRSKDATARYHLSASARLKSADTALVVQVDVSCDHPRLFNDPLNSDHIELWFALPRLFVDKSDNYLTNSPSCFYGDGTYFYLYTGPNTLSSFEREVHSPTIALSGDEDKRVRLNQIDSSDLSWLKPALDDYLTDAHSKSLRRAYAFYGIVHLGILPAANRAVLYDTEAYVIIKKQAGIDLPDYSSFVRVQSHIYDEGYSVDITLPPEALGFISKSGLERLRFLVDVVQTDSLGRQQLLMSTSPNRRWGLPETFNLVDFWPGVHASVLPAFKEFGSPYAYGEGAKTLGSRLMDPLSPVFLFTTKGWVPIDRNCEDFVAGDAPSPYYSLPKMQRCSFVLGKLAYFEDTIATHTLGHLTATNGDYLILDRQNIYPADEVIRVFVLPDSSVGLLTSNADYSERFNTQNSRLFLVAHSTSTLLANFTDTDSATVTLSNGIFFGPTVWNPDKVYWNTAAGENFTWSSLISLGTKGDHLVLDFAGSLKYVLRWDDHGQNIKVARQ